MGAVFEQIRRGHGCCRKAVDEDGFELAFKEVNRQKGEGEGL